MIKRKFYEVAPKIHYKGILFHIRSQHSERDVLACLHSDRLTVIGEVHLTSAGRGVRTAVDLGRVRGASVHLAVTELNVASNGVCDHWRRLRVVCGLKTDNGYNYLWSIISDLRI